jgi:hypothetical protein
MLVSRLLIRSSLPSSQAPVAYRGANYTTYRLELNPGGLPALYEGVRFGWIMVNNVSA